MRKKFSIIEFFTSDPFFCKSFIGIFGCLAGFALFGFIYAITEKSDLTSNGNGIFLVLAVLCLICSGVFTCNYWLTWRSKK